MGGGAGRRDADTSASATADMSAESGSDAAPTAGEVWVDGGVSMGRR